MQFEFLRLITCPYCGSDLKLEDIIEKKDEIVSGVAKCECSKFPIIEGILILKESPLNKNIIRLIKERKIHEATIRCLWFEIFEKIDYLRGANNLPLPISSKASLALGKILSGLMNVRAQKKYRKLYRQYSDKNVSFCTLLGESLFETYLKHRFSTETFWSLYPFIPLIKKRKAKILDLCCGAGHLSFALSKYLEPQQLCCADLLFMHLYLAKKYFVQNAQFICLDANNPLPFKNKTFSFILNSDALHYIRSRASLTREMERTLLRGGLILLLHLHNSLTYNIGAGYPLTPKTWVHFFEAGQLVTKVMPERKVVEDFLFRNKLDLVEKYAEADLNSSNAVAILAAVDKSLFAVYNQVDRDFFDVKDNLVINPIYEINERDENVLLKRSLQKYSLGDSYPIAENYLPEEYEISKEYVDGREVHIPDLEKVEELMKRFIILNTPENYI